MWLGATRHYTLGAIPRTLWRAPRYEGLNRGGEALISASAIGGGVLPPSDIGAGFLLGETGPFPTVPGSHCTKVQRKE
jgi:hypothetical protein